jgi:hypothetical protein
MTVYVVMGNDYPAAVFSTEEAAKTYCETATAKHEAEMRKMFGARGFWPRIYYRPYGFKIDAEKENA